MDGDFFGRTDLIFDNAADHGAGHVAAADKSEFHTKTSFLKMVEELPPEKNGSAGAYHSTPAGPFHFEKICGPIPGGVCQNATFSRI